MSYNYEELHSLFSLQRKEVERVLAESQQALENLEYNRHLLNQHQHVNLRLNEINTYLAIADSRIEELKLRQRAANLELTNLKEQDANSLISGDAQTKLSDPQLKAVFQEYDELESLQSVAYEIELKRQRHRKTELSGVLRIVKVELLELYNQRIKLQQQQQRFEPELHSIEQRLQANGIGATKPRSLPSGAIF